MTLNLLIRTTNDQDTEYPERSQTDHIVNIFVQPSSQVPAKTTYTPRAIAECPQFEYPLFFGPRESSTIVARDFDVEQTTGNMAFGG